MNKNLSNEIKNLIIVFLSDGKLRHVNEIKKFLKENGIDVYDNSSIFRNALFNLKKENPLLNNPKRGFYQLTQNPHTESNSTNSANLFDDFETVTKTTRKQPFLVVSIFILFPQHAVVNNFLFNFLELGPTFLLFQHGSEYIFSYLQSIVLNRPL